ncbi:MAG: MaoC/PaaZ C-terminal domain-containing protein [Smithella sp.]|nr:MaoC/PaaZ C-terminal domain-containing protein [Smithella sp.]
MALKYSDIEIGSDMPEYVTVPLSRTHLVRYAGASGDFNPLHHDQTFAKMIGMKNIIAHGLLIMGIAGEAIISWIGTKNLRKFGVRFLSMTEPVDLDDVEKTKDRATIIIKGKVIKKYKENGENKFECEITAQDALGSKKLSGFFIARLPE